MFSWLLAFRKLMNDAIEPPATPLAPSPAQVPSNPELRQATDCRALQARLLDRGLKNASGAAQGEYIFSLFTLVTGLAGWDHPKAAHCPNAMKHSVVFSSPLLR